MEKDFIIDRLNMEVKNITLYDLKPLLLQNQRLCDDIAYYIINKTIKNSAATTFTLNTIIEKYEVFIFNSCLIFLSDRESSLSMDIEYYYNAFLKKELNEKIYIFYINKYTLENLCGIDKVKQIHHTYALFLHSLILRSLYFRFKKKMVFDILNTNLTQNSKDNLFEYYKKNEDSMLSKIHKIASYYTSQVSSYKPIYKRIDIMYDNINYGCVDLTTKKRATMFIKQIDKLANSF